MSQSAVVA